MSKVFSALFGGGSEPKKAAVQPPREDDAEKARAEERRRLATARGFRSTILAGTLSGGGKTKLGQ